MPQNKKTRTAAGQTRVTTPKNRRAARPDPQGAAPRHPGQDAMRDRRYDRRPPKFPGRLGGR